MAIVSKSFTAKDVSSTLFIKNGDAVSYSITGTFNATLVLEYSDNNGLSYKELKKFTSAATNELKVDFLTAGHAILRLRCIAFVSGTAVTTLQDLDKNDKVYVFSAATAKAGATAGWVVNAGDNISLSTLPASQTASTLVVPLSFVTGEKIKSFYLIGQVESGGNTVTLDCDLKKHTSAAADVATSTVASMTQISVSADTAVTKANSLKEGVVEVVAEDSSYFALLTGTTDTSTDIALQAVVVVVEK